MTGRKPAARINSTGAALPITPTTPLPPLVRAAQQPILVVLLQDSQGILASRCPRRPSSSAPSGPAGQ